MEEIWFCCHFIFNTFHGTDKTSSSVRSAALYKSLWLRLEISKSAVRITGSLLGLQIFEYEDGHDEHNKRLHYIHACGIFPHVLLVVVSCFQACSVFSILAFHSEHSFIQATIL